MRRADLDKLEALLHYFNVTCASAVADMKADKRVLMLANVACVASEALMIRKQKDVTTDVLLNAAAPYYAELCEHLGDEKKPPEASETWIKFSAVAENTEGGGDDKVEAGLLLPKVIIYDETGAPMQEQEKRTEQAKTTPPQCVTIPWKEWSRSRLALQLGRERRRSRCCNDGATESPQQREDCRSTRRRRNEPGEQAEDSEGD